ISCSYVGLLSRCNEIVEGPQLDTFGNYKIFDRHSSEALDFNFTLGQQPGPCPLKVDVAIPGMTHQFRGALWQARQDSTDGARVQETCVANSIEASRTEESGLLQFSPEIPGHSGDRSANQVLFDSANR